MIETDLANLTAISGGELTHRHRDLYAWFQTHQHRVRPGVLDMTTLLLIHFLATDGAVEVGEPLPQPVANGKAKAKGKAKWKQPPPKEKPSGMRPVSTRGEPDAGSEPPEPPEPTYEEQGVDFKAVKKGTKVWVLAEGGTLDGEYQGPARNGRIFVKIAGRRESVDPEGVRIAT